MDWVTRVVMEYHLSLRDREREKERQRERYTYIYIPRQSSLSDCVGRILSLTITLERIRNMWSISPQSFLGLTQVS